MKTLGLVNLACNMKVSSTYTFNDKMRPCFLTMTHLLHSAVLLRATRYRCTSTLADITYQVRHLYLLSRVLPCFLTAFLSYSEVLAPEKLLGLLATRMAACGTIILAAGLVVPRAVCIVVTPHQQRARQQCQRHTGRCLETELPPLDRQRALLIFP